MKNANSCLSNETALPGRWEEKGLVLIVPGAADRLKTISTNALLWPVVVKIWFFATVIILFLIRPHRYAFLFLALFIQCLCASVMASSVKQSPQRPPFEIFQDTEPSSNPYNGTNSVGNLNKIPKPITLICNNCHIFCLNTEFLF